METYNGPIQVFIPEVNDVGYSTGSTSVRQTLINISNHNHTGATAASGTPIHGTNAIQAGTIDTASYKDGSITADKLAAQISFVTLANNAAIKWRNFANNADLSAISVDTSNYLKLLLDVNQFRLAYGATMKAATSGGTDVNLYSVDASGHWVNQSTQYTQHLLPNVTNTYDIGNSSGPLRLRRVYTHNIQFASGGSDLNWYEESNTWTPTIIGETTAGTATYTQRVGTYTRIGRRVFCNMRILWTGGTGSGNLGIAGLPYAAANTGANNNMYKTAIGSDNITYPAGCSQLFMAVGSGTTNGRIEGAGTGIGMQSTAYAAAGELRGMFSYEV